MLVTAEIEKSRLSDLIKQVQAGDEILLTRDNKPVAKIVSAVESGIASQSSDQDEKELALLWEKGGKAWKNLKSASVWVEDLRGNK